MAIGAIKKTGKKLTKRKVAVSKKVKDYNDDPFIVKKAKSAEAFLKKHGLPKALTR